MERLNNTQISHAALAVALALSCIPQSGHAQALPAMPGPPVFSSVDDHGVNVADGTYKPSQTLAAIGSLSYNLVGFFDDNDLTGTINKLPDQQICGGGGCTPATFYKVSVDGASYIFAQPTVGNPQGIITTAYFNSRGQSLTYDSQAQVYTHVDRDGTVSIFSKALANTTGSIAGEAVITSRQFKDGETWTYNWVSCGSSCNQIRSIVSSKGYMLKFDYSGSPIPAGQQTTIFTSVTAIDLAVDYCDPLAVACTYSKNWPHASVSFTPSSQSDWGSGTISVAVTDELNQTTTYTRSGGLITAIASPEGVQTSISYTNGKVSSLTEGGATWTYTYGTNTARITGADSLYTEYTVDSSTGDVSAIRDRAGNTTYKTLTSYGMVDTYSFPEGNVQKFDRNTGGSPTAYTAIPKSGSSLANIVIGQGYDCETGTFLCNKPRTFTDARGNVTNIDYNALGQVTAITAPAATTASSDIRPMTRLTYTVVPTYAKNASGGMDQLGAISVVTGKSECLTQVDNQTSCVGSSNERRTVTSYAGSNHAQPISVTVQAGDGSKTSTTSYTYDYLGDVATETGPLGSAQTTVYHYDAHGQLTGVVGPDPDGPGSDAAHQRIPSATKYTYNKDGVLTQTQIGTVADQTDTAWANFSEAYHSATTLDSYGRPIRQIAASGGTTYAISDTIYNNVGQVSCTIQYMSLAGVGNPATNCAPTQTGGQYGPDRVVQTTYDPRGMVASVTEGVGTLAAATSVTNSYSANGNLTSVTDGQGNLTSYTYDGLDRLYQVFYPSPTTVGTSSTTDYEQYSYDAASNLVSRRLRNATSIAYIYNNLNRLTDKTLPTGNPNLNPHFTYDLLGELTSATNRNGIYSTATSYTYDALGRSTSETKILNDINSRTTTSDYDAAGNRTKFIWNDGVFVTYSYDNTNQMTGIYESGTTMLATFAYDNLGRRQTLTRGNGTNTGYHYNAASRLDQLTLNGGSATNSYGFSYMPSGQIYQRSATNDAFAWTGAVNVNRNYTTNGLNQYSAITSVSPNPTYDPKGDLTSAGGATYSYGAEYDLATQGSYRFYYDPMHRMVYSTQVANRYEYDGADLVAEYDASGTLLRRYVFGSDEDGAIVWYEGTGLADKRWLASDERGSVVLVANTNGLALAINSYDEYGLGATTNSDYAGRFRYTSQQWLSELGMYYYKTRIYSPTLGRFVQPDRVGYGDGPNFYNYVHSDPINSTDPDGNTTVLSPATPPAPDPSVPEYSIIGQGCGGCIRLTDQWDIQQLFQQFTSWELLKRLSDPCGGALTFSPLGTRTALNERDASVGQGDGHFGTPRARGSHSGIDITGPVGAPVYASGSGKVFPITPNPSTTYGKQIVIRHTGDVYSQYAHLSSSLVRAGQIVTAGDVIGAVGKTGNTPRNAQSHLHFEVRLGSAKPRTAGGKVIDPLRCLLGGK